MEDFVGTDIWKVADVVRSPMSVFVKALEPGEEPPTVSVEVVEQRRSKARQELIRRGLTEEDLQVVEEGGTAMHRMISDYLAAGGSRYGKDIN
jgi:hypothetical protein